MAEAKIAALGLKIRNGRSYHGLALNIDMDLAPFADIDPCGYRGLAVTRLRDLGIDAPRAEIESRLVAALDAAIGAAPKPMSDARPAGPAGQRRRGQAQGGREDRAHPDQDRAGRAIEKAGLDSRARAFVAALPRDQAHPARAQAAHGLRGSLVPEHRRVLRQGHGDVHDHGRHLHAPLPVLRRRARAAAAAGCRRAGQSRRDDRGAEARLRRDHERRSRRPARRRRAAFRRLHTRGARTLAGDADRGAGARLPRPARARARRPRRRRRPT